MPQLADALVKLKHPSGGYIPDLERFSGAEGKALVGEVFTVEVRPALPHPAFCRPLKLRPSCSLSTGETPIRQSSMGTLCVLFLCLDSTPNPASTVSPGRAAHS